MVSYYSNQLGHIKFAGVVGGGVQERSVGVENSKVSKVWIFSFSFFFNKLKLQLQKFHLPLLKGSFLFCSYSESTPGLL